MLPVERKYVHSWPALRHHGAWGGKSAYMYHMQLLVSTFGTTGRAKRSAFYLWPLWFLLSFYLTLACNRRFKCMTTNYAFSN